MPFVFISHASACEALRANGLVGAPWPETCRMLPHRGSCIRLQRDVARLSRDIDLGSLGIAGKPVDILVPSSVVRSRGTQARTHSWSTLLPAHSMRRVHANVIVSTPEFVMLQLAHRHIRRIPAYDKTIEKHLADRELFARLGIDAEAPIDDVLGWEHVRHIVNVAQIAMEFAGTYRLSTPASEAAYDKPPLMTLESARAFLEIVHERNDSPRARRALVLAADGSASPAETALFLMLTLPIELGGFGLPKPELNRSVPVRIDNEDLTPDLLWRDQRLIVEYQSDRFHAGLGRDKTDRDIMRANTLRAAGYQVIETTPGIVYQLPRIKALADQIARLLGTVLIEADDGQRRLREHLHQELFLGGSQE